MVSKNLIYTLLSFTLLVIPLKVFADFGLSETADAAGLSQYGDSVPTLLGNAVGALLSLIGIVFFILVVYGGFMWMTAGGNQETVKKSINTIIAAAIGLIVVLSAYAITNFVFESVRGSGGGSSPFIDSDDSSTGGGGSSPFIDSDDSSTGGIVDIGGGQSAECNALGGTCGDPDSCDGDVVIERCPHGGDNRCCVPVETDAVTSEPEDERVATDVACRCTQKGEGALPGDSECVEFELMVAPEDTTMALCIGHCAVLNGTNHYTATYVGETCP